MAEPEFDVVTGAYGFSGRSITQQLLANGRKVITLTAHPARQDPFEGKVQAVPFNFDNPAALAESLRGADTLYNTYWIRFSHGENTFEKAVANSKILIQAARDAGVRRLVHISITHPSLDSQLPYFHGKAVVEESIKASGLSYAILRPAVLFGRQGILINNITWFLRHFPVFAAPGDGNYKLQPIYVEDLAALAVKHATSTEDTIIDAVGPETYTFNELLRFIHRTVDSHTLILHLPGRLVLMATNILGRLMHDVILTPDEVIGLAANLLVSDKPPTGTTKLSEWIVRNLDWLGREYMSEIKKHF